MKFSNWIFLWIMRTTVASLAPHGSLRPDTPDPRQQSLGKYPRGQRLRKSLSHEPGDRTADVCKADDLDTDTNKCCLRCPPGYYMLSTCGNKGFRCSQCPEGTFTEVENYVLKCKRCYSCNKSDLIQLKPCERDRNVQCGCQQGYYISDSTQHNFECGKCTECKNRGESVACSENQDTQCGTCHLGFYEDEQKNCRGCEKQDYGRPACQRFLTTTRPTPETTSKVAGPPGPLQPLVVSLSLVVILTMGGLLCYVLYQCTCCGRVPLPCTLGKTQKQSYQMCLARDTPKDKASPALPDQHWENHEDLFTAESKPPPLGISEMDGPHDASFKCNPATPLLKAADPKMLREDPQGDGWSAPVLYAIIRVVPVRRWKEFLRLLSVPDGQMERMELDVGPCYLEQQYQMLRLWSQAGDMSLEAIYATLHGMSLSGCAQELQDKLQQQATAAMQEEVAL